jgi:hypothetical protein
VNVNRVEANCWNAHENIRHPNRVKINDINNQ